jgi:SAM-dependent methyltransferase
MNWFKRNQSRWSLKRQSEESDLPLEGYDHWDDVGRTQFEFLLKEGLGPKDYFLDVGCGSFRSGRFVIDFLEAGHYFGLDRDRNHLDAGIKRVLRPSGLTTKNPSIRESELTKEPQNFRKLLGRDNFNIVWIHAVFDHIPPESIKRSILDFSEILCTGGRMYATIFLNPHGDSFREPLIHPRNGSLKGAVVTFPDREYWHHSLEFFQDIVQTAPALKFDGCLYNYPHPLGLRMLRFVRKA